MAVAVCSTCFNYYYVIDAKVDLSYGYMLLKKSDKTGFFFIEKTVLVISLHSTFAIRIDIALEYYQNILK